MCSNRNTPLFCYRKRVLSIKSCNKLFIRILSVRNSGLGNPWYRSGLEEENAEQRFWEDLEKRAVPKEDRSSSTNPSKGIWIKIYSLKGFQTDLMVFVSYFSRWIPIESAPLIGRNISRKARSSVEIEQANKTPLPRARGQGFSAGDSFFWQMNLGMLVSIRKPTHTCAYKLRHSFV